MEMIVPDLRAVCKPLFGNEKHYRGADGFSITAKSTKVSERNLRALRALVVTGFLLLAAACSIYGL
jgi:hypothetical protein